MKSDVFHAYDPTSTRESTLGITMSRPPESTSEFDRASSPEIGYLSPFSSDLIRFSTRMNQGNGDISGKATPCKICPQYGHAIIFSRKCYYEPQCPLPRFLANHQHGERPVRTFFIRRGFIPPSAQNFLRRLSSTLSKKIAFKDPAKQMTNFGWMKKDEVPYHLRHGRGSQ